MRKDSVTAFVAMLSITLSNASPLRRVPESLPVRRSPIWLDGDENINSTSYHPRHQSRQANQYSQAVKKGKQVWDMMINPRRQDQRTGTYGELAQWGWVASEPDKCRDIIEEKTDGLEDAFASCHLKFDTSTSANIIMAHKNSVVVDGKRYPATHAEYSAVYSPTQGAVVIHSAHSPVYTLNSAGIQITKDNIPGISHPSDVLYLVWQHLTRTRPTPLRYIFVRGITSQSQPTRDIIWQALRTDNRNLRTPPQGWKNAHMFKRPGQNGDSTRCDDPFYAVLGTFNFRAVGYMIAQHQDMFREKVVSSIYVWAEGDYLHGMAHIS